MHASAYNDQLLKRHPGRNEGVPLVKSISSGTSATTSRQVVLVCEDARIREQISKAVNSMSDISASVGSVSTAEAAIRLLCAQPHDVAIIDTNSPGARTEHLLETIRTYWSWIQIILMVNPGDFDNTKQNARYEVVECLTKPCSQREIATALTRADRTRSQTNGGSANGASAAVVTAAADASSSPASRSTVATASAPKSELIAMPAAETGARPPSLEEVERWHIFAALERNDGNREAAANELGISVRKLYYRLQQYQHEH